MIEIYKERLTTLAQHLLTGELGHENFDFSCYNGVLASTRPNYVEKASDYDKNGCGTNGCAIGECPTVFPNEWIFNASHAPVLATLDELRVYSVDHSIQEFFGVNMEELEHLFYPSDSAVTTQKQKYGGKTLTTQATKEDVANNILEFVKIFGE